MEVLTEAPKTSSFIPLAEHQSATPASFYNGPPVLHYFSDRCKLIVSESEASVVPALANIISKASRNPPLNGDGATSIDADPATEQRKVIEDIDVWVTSDKLLIYSTPLTTGLSIPYPSISLHAIQSLPEPSSADTSGRGLYMQLVYMSGDTTQSEDTEPESISVTIIPTATAPPQPQQASTDASADIANEDLPEQTPVSAMFAALSNCSNLHPDPVDDEEEEEMDMGGGGDGALAGSRLYQSGLVLPGGTNGGLPPPMPGSGGWITAENMHEYFDQDGNWIGPEDGEGEDGPEEILDSESLGPGAGTTRPRDVDGADGDAAGEEVKWRRTDE